MHHRRVLTTIALAYGLAITACTGADPDPNDGGTECECKPPSQGGCECLTSTPQSCDGNPKLGPNDCGHDAGTGAP